MIYIIHSIIFFVLIIPIHSQPKEPVVLNVGEKAPVFFLPTLDGDRVHLNDFTGAILRKPFKNKIKHKMIVSFFATYCQPCMKEVPLLQQFYDKHKAEPIKVFLIGIDKEGADILDPFVREKKISLPILIDKYLKTAEQYGATKLPKTFILDEEGTIRDVYTGFKEGTDLVAELEKKIKMIGEGVLIKPSQEGEVVVARTEDIIAPHLKLKIIKEYIAGKIPLPDLAKKYKLTPQDIQIWERELDSIIVRHWGTKK